MRNNVDLRFSIFHLLPSPMPPRRRLSWREFCDVVREAVESLPDPFPKYLENVAVDVEEEPTDDDYAALDERGDPAAQGLLLGLFIGVPLTKQGFGTHYPNMIKIFRRPLEQVSRTRGALFRNIRSTVVHEFAHHFGFTDAELEAFDRAQEELADAED
jgi:predicted Zn-dependent protease with MMP-like domain